MGEPTAPEANKAPRGTLVLFRHGETDFNAQNLMTGWKDVPLNATGEEQARAAGRAIRIFHVDKVYASTLSRTFNTAALALEAAGNQEYLKTAEGWNIEQRPELLGTNMGSFTGRNFKADSEVVNFDRSYEKPLPGGESDSQITERVQKFYVDDLLPRLERGETVLVVGHSGTMRAFDVVLGFRAPGEEAPDKNRAPNAAPVVVEYAEGKIARRYTLEPMASPAAPKPESFRPAA